MLVDTWIKDIPSDYHRAMVPSDDTKLPIGNVWFRVARENYIGTVEQARLSRIYEDQNIGFYAVIVPVGDDWEAQRALAMEVLRQPCQGLQFDAEPYSDYLGSEAGLQAWLENVLYAVALRPPDYKELSLTYNPRDHWIDGWDFERAAELVDSLAPMVYTGDYGDSAWDYPFKEEWGHPVLAIRRARAQCPPEVEFKPILQGGRISTEDTIASYNEAIRLGGMPSLFRRGTVPKATWEAIEGGRNMEIQPGLTYLTRAEWGARTDIPRLGHDVARTARTEAIIHHTVAIDDDATPNLWETLDEVRVKMRQLQVIRPDLGLDVPYNFVAFHMADGSLIICEGRGLDRTGAHTQGHNTRGVATAGEGNFQIGQALSAFTDHWSRWWGWLKLGKGMSNLGSSRPTGGPNIGAIAFGHRDFVATGCPGNNLYTIIPRLTFASGQQAALPVEEEDEMRIVIPDDGRPQRYRWLGDNNLYLIPDPSDLQGMLDQGYKTVTLRAAWVDLMLRT